MPLLPQEPGRCSAPAAPHFAESHPPAGPCLRRTPLPLQLRQSLGLQPFTMQLTAPADRGGAAVPPLELTHFLVADTSHFVAVQFNTAGEVVAQSDCTAREIAKHHPFHEVIVCPHGYSNYMQPADVDLKATYGLEKVPQLPIVDMVTKQSLFKTNK